MKFVEFLLDRKCATGDYKPLAKRGSIRAESIKKIKEEILNEFFPKEKPKFTFSSKADYDEYIIHAAKKTNTTFIPAELPEAMKPYFPYALNRLQSAILKDALNDNANMLISAPTSSGKTDCAIICILNTLLKHPEAIVIYVAPMKSLCYEITMKLKKRLNVSVKEWTGDTQLTQREIETCKILVMTPEKLDLVTRKKTIPLEKLKLCVLDEVHLLNDEDRGGVLEALVARLKRHMEISQQFIRLLALSATLPNYLNVAEFLNTKIYFYFDDSYRPVPLETRLVGMKNNKKINTYLFERVKEVLLQERQVMIFTHSRKDTINTLKQLLELSQYDKFKFPVAEGLQFKSCNRELSDLLNKGLGFHHAGMLREDRILVENLFKNGSISVLCCTSTLAWGVNLPAYSVIIKGTDVFQNNSKQLLSVLDVQQIFGRAGRPQYEDEALAILITKMSDYAYYLARLGVDSMKFPIESTFLNLIDDHLNAEICCNTVSSLSDGIEWLGYTYLYCRMKLNPMAYGFQEWDPQLDPLLIGVRKTIIQVSLRRLQKLQMVSFDERSGVTSSKDMGKVACDYYVTTESVERIQELLHKDCKEADILSILSFMKEYESVKLRESEGQSLELLIAKGLIPCEVKLGPENVQGKVNVLLQAYISRANIDDAALTSDLKVITDSAGRLLRALFDICVRRGWASAASACLDLCKSAKLRRWSFEHPLYQVNDAFYSKFNKNLGVPNDIMRKLDDLDLDIDTLKEMDEKEIGSMIRTPRYGAILKKFASYIPYIHFDTRVAPITRTVLKIDVSMRPEFEWCDKISLNSEFWHLWIESEDGSEIISHESLTLTKYHLKSDDAIIVTFMVPLPPTSSQFVSTRFYLRALSDRWFGADFYLPIDLRNVLLPEFASPHTDLLDIHPLPVTALHDEKFIYYYEQKGIKFFNPIQTQVFHTLYNLDCNSLVGAPTGSGKTICAELAMFSVFSNSTKKNRGLVVYIAPLKALVRERVLDWTSKFKNQLNKTVVELTGDVTPDLKALNNADLVITTPEKWDGISRQWKHRKFVQRVKLVIIDEIHLLGGERGVILEVIVSRMNFISFTTGYKVRLVGLSTALANAKDLAYWLNIPSFGLFNFRHSVRPVPIEIYIDGFPGRHYCPRMATMNKPIYQSILVHSPAQPVLVFVSSRRQTRLTANDLISLLANSNNTKRFLLDGDILSELLEIVEDEDLKHCLQFGIALHHAGLTNSDKQIVEELFLNQKVQILIATSTLAWGVNYPAHLVIVKGTEFYDTKTNKYVDYPMTDVLQMIGRAGRPQFDTSAIAHILVHDEKKAFYKKFLHEPFPVESNLYKIELLTDHLNAEIVNGSILNRKSAVEYLTWTYFYRRLKQNPSFYGFKIERNDDDGSDPFVFVTQEQLNKFLSEMVDTCLKKLEENGMIEYVETNRFINETREWLISDTRLGEIASYYYIQYSTIGKFVNELRNDGMTANHLKLLELVSLASEFSELPVRHNEDIMNRDLYKKKLLLTVPGLAVKEPDYNSPHFKTLLLLLTHLLNFEAASYPIADYYTDCHSVLDQAIRVIQCLLDVAGETIREMKLAGKIIELLQCIKSGVSFSSEMIFDYYPVSGINSLLSQNYISRPSIADDLLDQLPFVQILKQRIYQEGRENEEVTSKKLQSHTQYAMKFEIMMRKRRPVNENLNMNLCTAYTPKFPKQNQTEGWMLLLGDPKKDALIALRRFTFELVSENKALFNSSLQCHELKKEITLKLMTPRVPDEEKSLSVNFAVSLFSDTYRGFDQSLNIDFEIVH